MPPYAEKEKKDNAIKSIPKKLADHPLIKEGMEILESRGATEKQIRSYKALSEKILGREKGGGALELLNAVLSNTGFDLNKLNNKLVGDTHMLNELIERTDNPENVRGLFVDLMSNQSIDINLIFYGEKYKEIFVFFEEISGIAEPIEGFDVDKDPYENLLSEIVSNKNFRIWMIDRLKTINELMREYEGLRLFSGLIGIHAFDDDKELKVSVDNLTQFIQRIYSEKENLPEKHRITAEEFMCSLIDNSSFDPRKFDRKMQDKLLSVARTITELDPSNTGHGPRWDYCDMLEKVEFNEIFLDDQYIRNIVSFSRFFEENVLPSLRNAKEGSKYVSRVIKEIKNPKIFPIILRYSGEILEMIEPYKFGISNTQEELYANVVYGILHLGIEKVRILNSELGIVFFKRYKPAMLEKLYNNLQNGFETKKPLLVVAVNKNDYNGAFYDMGRKLQYLESDFNIMVVEVSGRKEYAQMIERMYARFGNIHTGIIVGHSTENDILLGAYKSKGKISINDETLISGLRKYFEINPTIVIDGCSSGGTLDGVGRMISQNLMANVLAPDVVAYGGDYVVNNKNEISRVVYLYKTVDEKTKDEKYVQANYRKHSFWEID